LTLNGDILNFVRIILLLGILIFQETSYALNLDELLTLSEKQIDFSGDYETKENVLKYIVEEHKAALWPQLKFEANGGFGRSRGDLVLRQVIYDGGITYNKIKLSEAELEYQKAGNRTTVLYEKLKVVNAYYDAILAHELKLFTQKKVLPRYKVFKNFFNKAFHLSAVSKVDAIGAQMQYASLENDIYNLELRLDSKIHELKFLTGVDGLSIKTLSAELREVDFSKKLNHEAILSLANKKNYIHLLNAKKDELINRKRSLELAPYRPKLFALLRGRYDTKDHFEYTGGVSLDVPIFNGFITKWKNKKYDEMHKEALVDKKLSSLKLKSEIDRIIYSHDFSIKKIRLANKQIPVAKQVWYDIKKEFDVGSITSSRMVSSALSQFVQLQSKKIEQIIIYNRSLSALTVILGAHPYDL